MMWEIRARAGSVVTILIDDDGNEAMRVDGLSPYDALDVAHGLRRAAKIAERGGDGAVTVKAPDPTCRGA